MRTGRDLVKRLAWVKQSQQVHKSLSLQPSNSLINPQLKHTLIFPLKLQAIEHSQCHLPGLAVGFCCSSLSLCFPARLIFIPMRNVCVYLNVQWHLAELWLTGADFLQVKCSSQTTPDWGPEPCLLWPVCGNFRVSNLSCFCYSCIRKVKLLWAVSCFGQCFRTSPAWYCFLPCSAIKNNVSLSLL